MFARPGDLLAPFREQPEGSRRLLWQMTLWWLASTLAGTFVNAFLYRSTHDPMVNVCYTLSGFVTYTLLVTFMGAVLKRADRAAIWRWGTAVNGLMYLIFLLAGERAGQAPVLLGIINGLGQIAFWPAFGVLAYHVTEPRTRAGFNALHGIICSVAGMVVPPVAGLLVDRAGTEWGYRLLFAGALVLYGWAIAAGFRHEPAPTLGEPFRIGDAVRRSFLTPVWRGVLISHIFLGIREGLMLFLPGLLVFVVTGSEGALGSYSMVMSLLGTAANGLAGRLYRGRVPPVPLMTATLLLALSPVLLWVGVGLVPLLLFSIATTVTTPFLNVATGTIVPALIDADHEARTNIAEYQSVRDVVFVGGRCVAIFAYMVLMPHDPTLKQISFVLLATSAAVIPGVLILLWLDHAREAARAATVAVDAS